MRFVPDVSGGSSCLLFSSIIITYKKIIDDMLFAIGGFNGVTTIFNVECYDINADEWLVLSCTRMPAYTKSDTEVFHALIVK